MRKRCGDGNDKRYISDLVDKMVYEHEIIREGSSRLNFCSMSITSDPPSIFDRIGELCNGELS